MKKLMITALFAVASLTVAQAQETASINTNVETTIKATTQDFVAVDLKNVPPAILKAVTTDFESATLAKAWKNEKNEYKLELVSLDDKVMQVYANSKGEWIKKE